MSCHQGYGLSNYLPCSGNGACVNNYCQCYENWSSISDLLAEPGFDCDINIKVIKYWALANIIISIIGIFFIFYCLYHEYSSAMHRRISVMLITKDDKQLLYFSTCIASIMVLIYSIFKFIEPEHANLGSKSYPHMTILALGVFSSTMFAGSSLAMILIKLIHTHLITINSLRKQQLIKFMDKISSLAYTFPCMIVFCLAIIVIANTLLPSSQSKYCYIGYQLIFTIVFASYTIPSLYIIRTVIAEVSQSIDAESTVPTSDHNDMISVRKMFQSMYNIVINLLLPCIPVDVIFVSWRFMRRKFVYLICFQNTVTSLFAIILSLLIYNYVESKYESKFRVPMTIGVKSSKIVPVTKRIVEV